MEIPHVPKYFIIIIMVPPACLWPFCAGGPTAGASAPQSCRGRIASLDLPAELALTQPSMLGMFFLTQPHLPHCMDRSQNSENLQERKNTASLPDPGPKDGGLRCLPQMCSQFVWAPHPQPAPLELSSCKAVQSQSREGAHSRSHKIFKTPANLLR